MAWTLHKKLAMGTMAFDENGLDVHSEIAFHFFIVKLIYKPSLNFFWKSSFSES